jgi:hypothetical protein
VVRQEVRPPVGDLMMSDEPCCGGGVRSDGVEGACVGDHGQPLSPVHRDPGGEPRRRDEMATEHLYEALQREAPGGFSSTIFLCSSLAQQIDDSIS